jgi:hypothetical protein
MQALKGKKTYFCAVLGLIYIGGSMLGFYEFDEKVLAGIGAGALMSLRAAIGNATKLKKDFGEALASESPTSQGGSPLSGGGGALRDVQRGSVLRLLLCAAVVGLVTGCANYGKISEHLKGDAAIVVLQVGSPWGVQKLTRVGGQTNSVAVSPDGTVSINPPQK